MSLPLSFCCRLRYQFAHLLSTSQFCWEGAGEGGVHRPVARVVRPRVGGPGLHVVPTTDEAPPEPIARVHYLGARNVAEPLPALQVLQEGAFEILVLHDVVVQQGHLVVLQGKLAQLEIDLGPDGLRRHLEHPLLVCFARNGDAVAPVAEVGVLGVGHKSAKIRLVADYLPLPRPDVLLVLVAGGARSGVRRKADRRLETLVAEVGILAQKGQNHWTVLLHNVEDFVLSDLDAGRGVAVVPGVDGAVS